MKGNVERKSNSQNTDKPVDKQTRMFKDDNRLACNLKDLKNNKYLQEIYRDMGRFYNEQSFLQVVKAWTAEKQFIFIVKCSILIIRYNCRMLYPTLVNII